MLLIPIDAKTFLALRDTFPTFSGAGLEVVRVNRDGTALVSVPYPNFRVDKGGTSQIIETGIATKVSWSGSSTGRDDYFDFANNRFTPTNGEEAEWAIYSSLLWSSAIDQDTLLTAIHHNGVNITRQRRPASGIGLQNVPMLDIVTLDGIDDYIEIFATQSSGSDRSVNGSTVSSWFCGWRIR